MIKAVKIFIEVMGWLIITGIVTLCVGLLYLFLFYTHWENDTVALIVLIAGFIVGAILATKNQHQVRNNGMALKHSSNLLNSFFISLGLTDI